MADDDPLTEIRESTEEDMAESIEEDTVDDDPLIENQESTKKNMVDNDPLTSLQQILSNQSHDDNDLFYSELKPGLDDIIWVKSFLKDISQVSYKNEVQRELARQMRDVIYRVECSANTFLAQAALQTSRSSFAKAFHKFAYRSKLKSLAKGIRQTREKIYDFCRDIQKNINNQQYWDESAETTKQKKGPIVEKNNVVGFQDEAEKIIKFLIGGSEELEVIPIVGMPGIGKTALAEMIFHDPQIENEFHYRAWIYVSQTYSTKELFCKILSDFGKLTDNMYHMDDTHFESEICTVLWEEKYLIVMDDVWTTDTWDDLKFAFLPNNKRSRILLTTRIDGVAKHVNPDRKPHILRFLTPEESWTLLERKAFNSHECPKELREHVSRIANECQGLPLALEVIGAILLEKGAESYWWEKVAKHVNAYIAMDPKKHIHRSIALSFKNLPHDLKACFLYFGMFPKDFQIPVWKLVCLWIAEGFIPQMEFKSLEDIAEDYLESLVGRNLVKVGEWSSNGKPKTCHVHGVVHIFCKYQAAYENFFHEIQWFDQVAYSSSNPSFEMYRRLCIHSCVLNYISSKPYGPLVQSFLCSSKQVVLPSEHISSIPKAFRFLRVLDAKPICFPRFPAKLTHLVNLSYLVLFGNFSILPETISSLVNMQTLIIETSSRTLEIKGDIFKMIKLRHIKTNAFTSLPGSLAKARKIKEDSLLNENLKTLSTISPESCLEDVLSRAPKLQKLGIRGRLATLLDAEDGSSIFDGLGKLDYLEKLKLLNDIFPQHSSEGRLPGLPESCKFPPKLKKLTLADTFIEWEHMSTLGMLESLEILKLKDNAFKGESWQPQDGGFQNLEVLHIGRTDLVYWNAASHHFPRLRYLCLKHCINLKAIPFGLANVSSFQVMELYCTTESTVASARNIQLHKQNMHDSANPQTTEGGGFKLSIYLSGRCSTMQGR